MVDYDAATRISDLEKRLKIPHTQVLRYEFTIGPDRAHVVLNKELEKGIQLLQELNSSGTYDLGAIQKMGTTIWNRYLVESNKIKAYASNAGFPMKDYPTDVPETLREICKMSEEPLLVPEDSLGIKGGFDPNTNEIPLYIESELEPSKGFSF